MNLTDFPEETLPAENLYCDMKGAILNISVVAREFDRYDSYTIVQASGEVKIFPCIAYELLAVLQISMNFTPNLKPTDNWGTYDHEKSEWTGMVGHLIHNVSELALGGAVDMPLRRTVVDFNLYVFAWRFLALYRAPNSNHDKFASLRPFSPFLWLALGAFNISLILALLFVSTVRWRHGILDTKGSTCVGRRQNCQPSDCIFWPLKTLCCKGIHPLPGADSIRIVVFMGCLAAMVLNAAYSGTLLSFVKVASRGFTSFDQLLQTSFTFDTRPNATFLMLQASVSPPVINTIRRMKKKPTHREVIDAREQLLQGSFVFLAHDLAAYETLNTNFNTHDRCLINDLILPMQTPKCGTMVRKKSPLKRIVDYQIIKAKQYGLNDCWLKRYIPRRPLCVTRTGAEDGIPISSVLVPMCILILGVVTSSVGLILEILLKSHVIA